MEASYAEARRLIERVANEVRVDALRPRFKRSIHLILGSFASEHVITELLQNADDVGATYVEIELIDEGLFFLHNGKDFDEADLRALCDIGETTKKPGVHIGFMGVGFKAAFKISDTPYVFSGPYHFHFNREDVIIPYWTPSENLPINIRKHIKKGYTTFFLPFRKDLPLEIVKVLEETLLEKLEPLCLVFLRNVSKIRIMVRDKLRVLTRTIEPLQDSSSIEKIHVIEQGDTEKNFNYLVYKKALLIPEYVKDDYRAKESRRSELQTTDATLVFSIQENSLKPMDSTLYTFLPTPFKTGLRFTINCDFLLNTQRSEPDFTSRWNLWLFESVGVMLREAVEYFIQNDAYQLSFYEVLPRREEKTSDIIYEKICKPLIAFMKNSPCILTANGIWAKPSEVAIASKDVIEIIPPSMAGVSFYVHPSIQGKAFLRDELGVKDLSGKSEEKKYVLQALQNEKWLNSLKEDHICKIYELLYHKIYDEKESWGLTFSELKEIEKQLKKMEIVKATNGRLYRAEEMLFVGDQTTDLTDLPCLVFVDPNVVSNESRVFLKLLGVKDFSDESIMERILDSQDKGQLEGWTDTQRLKAISYIAEVLRKRSYSIEEKVKEKMGNLALPTLGGGWVAASQCYVPTPELKELIPNANYVDISKLRDSVADLELFLEYVGVLKFPRLISLGEGLGRAAPPYVSKKNWGDYWSWLWNSGLIPWEGREHSVSTVCLDGFEDCIASQDAGKLKRYLVFLLQHWDDYYSKFEKSSFCWFHYTPRYKEVPSYFIFQLKTFRWLPTTHGLKEASQTFAPFREIKSIIGHIFPYVDIPEELARRNKDFLKLIGVKTEANLQTLISILNKIRELEVNDAVKAQLGCVYKKLANICEEEKIERIDENILILNTEGEFKPSNELIWIDNPYLGELFKKELPTAWVPENLSMPEAQTLFSSLGVKPISQLIEREILEAKEIGEDIQLAKNIVQKGNYVYSALLHSKARKAELFPQFIKGLKVIRVSSLKIQLKVLGKILIAEAPCFSDICGSKLIISSKADITDVARELSSTFDAALGAEFIISFILSQQSVDNIADQFKKSGIQLIPLVEGEAEKELLKLTESATKIIPKEVAEKLKDEFKSFAMAPPSEELREEVHLEFDLDEEKIKHEIEKAKTTLMNIEKVQNIEPSRIWVEPKEIERVVTGSKIVVRPFISISSAKNWELRVIDGEKVFTEVNIDPAKIEAFRPFIKEFRNRMRKIVEIMGGNPDTVNVCIANPETDADRRDGQLFFNIVRNDRPLRWIIVAARELAYLKFPNPSQQHVDLMTSLIEKAIAYIDEIYPEIFARVKKE
ncbi:MAG: hypothetical protein QXU81_11385 [Candidatus Bathyarchaeia archaeon]